MSRIWSMIMSLAVSSAVAGQTGPFSLDGKVYRPNAPIIWAATSPIPHSVMVYRIAPEHLSSVIISNAMMIGSFKPIDLIPSADKSVLHFQDSRDKTRMTKYLEIVPAGALVRYFNNRARGSPVTGVPTFEQVDQMATSYFSRLGGDTNQLAIKPRPRIEGTVTSLNRRGGRETNNVVDLRGAIILRQLDGIPVVGDSFSIDFGNNGKISNLELHWKNLKRFRVEQTASPEQMMDWVRVGRAVIPSSDEAGPDLSHATKLIVSGANLCYIAKPNSPTNACVYPIAQLGLSATLEGGNQANFYLNCPVCFADPASAASVPDNRSGTPRN